MDSSGDKPSECVGGTFKETLDQAKVVYGDKNQNSGGGALTRSGDGDGLYLALAASHIGV